MTVSLAGLETFQDFQRQRLHEYLEPFQYLVNYSNSLELFQYFVNHSNIL